jgi:hypothetical protein
MSNNLFRPKELIKGNSYTDKDGKYLGKLIQIFIWNNECIMEYLLTFEKDNKQYEIDVGMDHSPQFKIYYPTLNDDKYNYIPPPIPYEKKKL